MGFQRILVALDHSRLSESAFSYALELAQVYEASLKIFHCLTIEAMGDTAMPSVPSEVGHYTGLIDNVYLSQQANLRGRAEQVQNLLQSYVDMAASQGISTEVEQQVGSPGQSLCQAAKDWGADLIVLGRRGRKGLAEAFLGSVSNHVVHHASCSVLVIQAVQPLDEVEAGVGRID